MANGHGFGVDIPSFAMQLSSFVQFPRPWGNVKIFSMKDSYELEWMDGNLRVENSGLLS